MPDLKDWEDGEWENLIKSWDSPIETPNILPVTAMPDADLFSFYDQVKEQLLDMEEAIEQRTQQGRDLQSWRAALLIEMKKRGLK